MTPTEQAKAHDRNFIAAMSVLAQTAPHGSVTRHGPLTVAVTGVASSFFNTVVVTDPAQVPSLPAAVRALRATALPFVVHVRHELASAMAGAPKLGLTNDGLLPCFAIEPRPVPEAPAELSIGRVTPANWSDVLSVVARGFGIPAQAVESLYSQRMLEVPSLRAFIGSVAGQPMATSISIRTGDTVGVYSVTTLAEYRGRGYGTAMTWHLLADADPGWRVAVLQASEMGRPVYERMGFQMVREFAEFVGGPPPGSASS